MEECERQSATPWDLKDSERKPANIGDSERHAATPWVLRDSERKPASIRHSERQPMQQPYETVRDMQQLQGTGIDRERQPAMIRDCEKHTATP